MYTITTKCDIEKKSTVQFVQYDHLITIRMQTKQQHQKGMPERNNQDIQQIASLWMRVMGISLQNNLAT